ncbi:SPOSA6832_01500 [Sporobolomyces salmonicolor]|uniref:SPOSA6832_01500-mRNA-1:cds n=1 Tax=Sporidiobolus salmonicolor TaxID=5005 RepID=A0A0D6EJJ4_SPOSA|nr:SPOSA6832_01500 [Sporobolomyces salmonicolor]
MASPVPSYVPYTPKRHSTSSSISSFHHQPPSPSRPSFSHPASSSSSSSTARPASPTPQQRALSPLALGAPGSRSSSAALVRPGTGAGGSNGNMSSSSSSAPNAFLRQPQPSRPAFPQPWTGSSSASTATHSSAVAAGTAPSSSSTSPPPGSLPRPTPPPPPSLFPFASVPAGSSPFPPCSPVPPSSSSSTRRAPSPEKARMPYQAGFQPQGVRRDRSASFFEARESAAEGKRLEKGRLARRLDKLVALHFPPPGDKEASRAPNATPAPSPAKEPASALATLSQFGDSLRGRSAKEIWRTVAGNVDIDVERAEQSIVKWQDDKEATRCPICMATFGLTTRRHHCRLCGRVVCFLPPNAPSSTPFPPSPPSSASAAHSSSSSTPPTPTRRERCSTFFTYEYELRSGAGAGGAGIAGAGDEKRPMGFVVEIAPVEQDLGIQGVLASGAEGSGGMPQKQKEKEQEKRAREERKKVRVCRDCLNTVLRQQLKTLPVRTPTWLKLYEVLVQLEKEIDEILPEFQELALGLQSPSHALSAAASPSASQAKALRKRLLTNLASYDTLSKRLRALPLPASAPPNGSQDRLQRAIAARAGLWLGEKLALLRSLGSIEELGGGAGGGGGGGGAGAKKDEGQNGKEQHRVRTLASLLAGEELERVQDKVGPELEASGKLAVLLEQEALVRSYVDDAKSRRQFEDAASLQASLDELRAEIDSVRATLP